MSSIGSRLEYLSRVALTLFYFCSSLTTSSLILFYASLFGASSAFTKRVRCIFSVVTCAPWLLCFGIRLAIQNEHLVYAPESHARTINIGTHASHIDGLAMMVSYWRNRRFQNPPCAVVKREVLFTPFYGVFAYLVGNILVARGSTKAAAIESMDRVAQRTRDGYVIGAFPEGSRRRTRSTGKDHLMTFKKGTFHLVEKLATEEVPVTIAPFCLIGSRSAWPAGRLVPVSGSKVLLKFCPHIKPARGDTADVLLEKTRAAIEDGIESSARNSKGQYDIDAAFAKGTEVNMQKEFLMEAILLTIPPVVTSSLALLGML